MSQILNGQKLLLGRWHLSRKKTMKKYILPLALLLLLSNIFTSCKKEETIIKQIEGPTNLNCNAFKSSSSQKVTKLTNWRIGVDYVIDCVMEVEIDLTIDTGTTIAFNTDAGLYIMPSGSISAIGMHNKEITFTGVDKVKGAWVGIGIESNDVKNKFKHCIIEYAGSKAFDSNGESGNIVLYSNTYLRLDSTLITNGKSYGINSNYNNCDLLVENTNINKCSIPFYGNPNQVPSFKSGNFKGNELDIMDLYPFYPIAKSQKWEDIGIPYRIKTYIFDLTVNNGSTLTLAPGVKMEFESGQALYIDGEASSLIAVGTPEKPIVFTGVSKAPGAWKYIYFSFSSAPLNEISYATIEYAGNAGSGGSINMWANPRLKVTHVDFKDIGTCAMFTNGDTNPNLTESNNKMTNVTGEYICQ